MTATRIALFASVALNLLLVGVIAGGGLAALKREPGRTEQAAVRTPNMQVILRALPPERAAEVRSKVIDTWKEAKDARRESREARVALVREAAKENYDPAATRQAFARMRATDAEVAGRFHDTIADAMAEMTVQERRQLLRSLARQRWREARERGEQQRREGLPPEGAPTEPATTPAPPPP